MLMIPSDIVGIDLTIRYDNAVHVAGPNTLGGKVVAGDPPLVHFKYWYTTHQV